MALEFRMIKHDAMGYSIHRLLHVIFLLSALTKVLCGTIQNDEVRMGQGELMRMRSGDRRSRLEKHIQKHKAKNATPNSQRYLSDESGDNLLCIGNESLSKLFTSTRDSVSSFLGDDGNAIDDVAPFVRLVRESIANGNEVLSHLYDDKEILIAAMAPNHDQSSSDYIANLGSCVDKIQCEVFAEDTIAESIHIGLAVFTSLPKNVRDVLGNTFTQNLFESQGSSHIVRKVVHMASTSENDKVKVASIIFASIINEAGVFGVMKAFAESPDLIVDLCGLTANMIATSATGGASLAAKINNIGIDVAGVHHAVAGLDATCNRKCEANLEDTPEYQSVSPDAYLSDGFALPTSSSIESTLPTSSSNVAFIKGSRSENEKGEEYAKKEKGNKFGKNKKKRKQRTRMPIGRPTGKPTGSFGAGGPRIRRPTGFPTSAPTKTMTSSPTASSTNRATLPESDSVPTDSPTRPPPTVSPTVSPTTMPSKSPSQQPSSSPTNPSPTSSPSKAPSRSPEPPTMPPTSSPTNSPTTPRPTTMPSKAPTMSPTASPTSNPTSAPTASPSKAPSQSPTPPPTSSPSSSPSKAPSNPPTPSPSKAPTSSPSRAPTSSPVKAPSSSPTTTPTEHLSNSPTGTPTASPTALPDLVPAPSCNIEEPGYTYYCLQNNDFGVDDKTRYNFDLSLEVLNPDNANAYIAAREKWMEVIVGDLRPINTDTIPPGPRWRDSCRGGHLPERIDDLHVCARDLDIDGPGSILGYATSLWIRNTEGKVTSSTGEMAFDIADIERKVQEGSWESLILHEMGHILGIGTLWTNNNLVDKQLNYLGTQGKNVWVNDWGCTTDSPPVEKDGGSGTRGGHWDEQCLKNELMTGYAEQPGVVEPLSKLTIATLEDIGYTVNYKAADAYDASDIKTSCCRPSSNAPPEPEGIQRPISSKGRDAAIEFGHKILSQRQVSPTIAQLSSTGGSEQDDSDFIIQFSSSTKSEQDDSDLTVVVIYEEDGKIYDVHVTV